jgi:hypothetical protein
MPSLEIEATDGKTGVIAVRAARIGAEVSIRRK